MLSQQELLDAIPDALTEVNVPGLGPKIQGKVRDMYRFESTAPDGRRVPARALITTDRLSAFDRVLSAIPYKGQVLNQLSAWWFEQTQDIVANHVLSIPDPSVTLAVEAQPIPVEVIVRGYLTGVTKTSLWTMYNQGDRRPYGIPLPDGMQKNDPLPNAIITPTTKAEAGAHDEQLTRDQIIQRGLVPEALWVQVEQAALGIFARGQERARQGGLILVDTKYEFGLVEGQLVVMDEVHTPDSSRFWIADTVGQGREPENLDKEYLRLWFVAQGYRGDGEPPVIPPEMVARVAARYIEAYERLTGLTFVPGASPVADRIRKNLAGLANKD